MARFTSQGVISLLKYGVYANFPYNHEDLTGLRFPIFPQGIFPQGIFSQYLLNLPFIQAFGVHHFVLQVPNLIFLFVSAFLLFHFVGRLTRCYWLGLLSIFLFFLLFPGVAPSPLGASVSSISLVSPSVMIPSLALAGFGEIPAFFYLLLSTLLLYRTLEDKRYCPLLGISLYLMFDSKLFLILAVSIVIALLFLVFKIKKTTKLSHIILVIVIFCLPIFLINFLFLVNSGFEDWTAFYSTFWRFVRYQQYGSIPISIAEHIRRAIAAISLGYGSLPGFYLPLFFGYGLSLFALFRDQFNLDGKKTIILLLFLTSLTYTVWWFHFSTVHQWYRRILPLLMLNIPLFALSTADLFNRSITFRGKMVVAAVSCFIFLPMLATQTARFIQTFELKTVADEALRDRQEMVEIIERLPGEERIFGIGWWQAPRLSLFSGRIFLDIERNQKYDRGYLVFDQEALQFGREQINKVLATYDVELVKGNNHSALYRWKTKH